MKKTNLIFCLLTCLFNYTATAAYRSPAYSIPEGQNNIGFSVDLISRDMTSEGLGDDTIDATRINLDFAMGVGPASTLALHVGPVFIDGYGDDSYAGGDAGVSFHHLLDSGSNDTMRKGLFLSYHYGYLEEADTDTSMDYYEYVGGFGVSNTMNNNLNMYAGGVYSFAEADIYGYYDYYTESDMNFGIYAGIESATTTDSFYGLELHLLHESSISAYIQMKF